MKLYILAIFSLIMTGCMKHPIPSPCKLPDCSDTVKYTFKQPDSFGSLPILWYKIAHAPDTSASNQWCFATEEGVILVNTLEDQYNTPYVRFLDRVTGEEKWYWNNLKGDSYSDIQYMEDRNLLMIKFWRNNAVLNTANGVELFSSTLPDNFETSSPNGQVIGNYFYTSLLKNNSDPKTGTDYAKVIRTRLDDGKSWETIYTRTENEINGFTPYFHNMKLWIHPNTQDSIILINNRMYHWERHMDYGPNSGVERTDVIAYNLSKRKVEWVIDSICKSSSINDPFLIIGNSAFFKEGNYFSKIDLLNHDNQYFKYKDFGGGAIYDSINNNIIGMSLGISSVSVNSQHINWSLSNPSMTNQGDIELFEGYIYVLDPHEELYVINATTGKIVFKQFSLGMLPGRSILGMRGRASIDRVNRLLYCSDLWGTYCLKLPDKWE